MAGFAQGLQFGRAVRAAGRPEGQDEGLAALFAFDGLKRTGDVGANLGLGEASEQQGGEQNEAFHGLILIVRRPSAVVFQTSHSAWRALISSGSSAAPAVRASVVGADQRLPLSRECMVRIRLSRPSNSRQTSVTWRPLTAICGWPAWASRLPKGSGGVCVSPTMRR